MGVLADALVLDCSRTIRVRPPLVLIGYGERHRRRKLEPLEVVAICDHLLAFGAAELEHKIGGKPRSVTPIRSSVPVPNSQGFRDGVMLLGFAKGMPAILFRERLLPRLGKTQGLWVR